MFQGSFVALVTPFDDELRVDFGKLEELIEFHLSEGTHGLVPCGTTGETPALSKRERQEVIEFTVARSQGKVPVIAGTGSYNTAEAVEMSKWAQDAGVDGLLVVTPYYNKPTPEGLYRHYEAIDREVQIPIVLYNVPGRTGLNLTPEVVERLAQLENVRAIKEASGNLSQVLEIASRTDLVILSGDDNLTVPILSVGGRGVISVSANIVPRDMAELVDRYLRGEVEEAGRMARRLCLLCKALFYETNPIPVKAALKLMGKLNGRVRPPLAELGEANELRLRRAMEEYGLL